MVGASVALQLHLTREYGILRADVRAIIYYWTRGLSKDLSKDLGTHLVLR